MLIECESFKRETDLTCRERCGRRAIGYVISWECQELRREDEAERAWRAAREAS